jgi:HSP20 family protein
MTLSLYPNFSATTRNPVDTLFESLWENTKANYRQATLSPRVDVYDEGDTLVVEAEMPGVKKSDVEVTFERGIRVSESIDTDAVQASFEDGILKLVLKRKPEAATKRIDVQ